MPRKITHIRRSLHNAFKHKAKCEDYLKLLPNGGFLYNLVKADLNATNKIISKLRSVELANRIYLVNASKLVDPGPAYPTKSIKNKSFA